MTKSKILLVSIAVALAVGIVSFSSSYLAAEYQYSMDFNGIVSAAACGSLNNIGSNAECCAAGIDYDSFFLEASAFSLLAFGVTALYLLKAKYTKINKK